VKRYIIIIAVCIMPAITFACDICGSGAGNNYLGILPDFQQRIVGIRYRYSSLLTHLGVNGAATHLTTNEKYTTAEIWGSYTIAKGFRVMASIPYGFNAKHNAGITDKKTGIGDATVTAFYSLINNRKSSFKNKVIAQSLWLGGGIKLPTGKYAAADKNGTNESTNLFQLGTGSTDFTLNTMYDLRVQDIGINISSAYKINTTNKYDYKYGNKLSLSGQLYYKIKVNSNVTISPNTGIAYETAQEDYDNNINVNVSGGNITQATFGAEASFNKIAFGGNYQTPLQQNLGNGFVKAKARFMLHIAYSF